MQETKKAEKQDLISTHPVKRTLETKKCSSHPEQFKRMVNLINSKTHPHKASLIPIPAKTA
jgi:hypothetical protein